MYVHLHSLERGLRGLGVLLWASQEPDCFGDLFFSIIISRNLGGCYCLHAYITHDQFAMVKQYMYIQVVSFLGLLLDLAVAIFLVEDGLFSWIF